MGSHYNSVGVFVTTVDSLTPSQVSSIKIFRYGAWECVLKPSLRGNIVHSKTELWLVWCMAFFHRCESRSRMGKGTGFVGTTTLSFGTAKAVFVPKVPHDSIRVVPALSKHRTERVLN